MTFPSAEPWARLLLERILTLDSDELGELAHFMQTRVAGRTLRMTPDGQITIDGTGVQDAPPTLRWLYEPLLDAPPAELVKASLWDNVQPRDPAQAVAYINAWMPLLKLLAVLLAGGVVADDVVEQVLTELRGSTDAQAPADEPPPPPAEAR